MTHSRIVLFDLDGTLLDTAADIVDVVNQVRREFHFPEIPFADLRPAISHGIKGLLRVGNDIDANHDYFPAMVEKCFALYREHPKNASRLFPNMDKVLDYLDAEKIPWGIVTNKPARFTPELLKQLGIEHRTACVVCGDTLSRAKPYPDPIWHACKLLKSDAANCIFIGDSIVDANASKAAGTKLLIALYGYIGNDEEPLSWKADGYINDPGEIIDWLKKNPACHPGI